MPLENKIIAAAFVVLIVCLICALFGWYRTHCYVCGKKEWVYRMDSDCVFGSGPETAEFALRHHTCNPEERQ